MKKLLSFLQRNKGWQSIDHSLRTQARQLQSKGLVELIEYPKADNYKPYPQVRIIN